MKEIKKQLELIKDDVYVHYYSRDKKEITKDNIIFEIFIKENGKILTKGFQINRIGKNVHNGQLFAHYKSDILNRLFDLTGKGLRFKTGSLKNNYMTLNVKNERKFIVYELNGKVIYKIRKKRIEIKKQYAYVVTQKSLNKAFNMLSDYFESFFNTNKNDFLKCKDVISAIDNYLLN